MALTEISVTLLFLVGIMSVTFAAPDQTAELGKLNENQDAMDVSVAAERPDQSAELEEEDENGDVQRLSCARKYRACLHYFGRRCLMACYFNYYVCVRLRRGQDPLDLPRQPTELEEENENGDVQHHPPPPPIFAFGHIMYAYITLVLANQLVGSIIFCAEGV